MITETEVKKVLSELVPLIESYLQAAEMHSEAEFFGDEGDEDADAANVMAETIYPDLMKAIEAAKELLEA